MAGEEGFALAVILLTVVFRIIQDQRRRRFLAKLRLLSRRSGQRRLIGHMLHRQHQKHKQQQQQQQRPRRKRKMVWVHPRPQFWFERMLVNQYEDHLWQERAFEREIEREIERTSFERAFERWDHIHAGKLLTEAKIRHTWVVSQHRRALVVVEENLFHSYRQEAEE